MNKLSVTASCREHLRITASAADRQASTDARTDPGLRVS